MPDPTLPPNDPKHPGGKSVAVKTDESQIIPESPEQETED